MPAGLPRALQRWLPVGAVAAVRGQAERGHLLHALGHVLTGAEVVGMGLELDGHLRDAELAGGADAAGDPMVDRSEYARMREYVRHLSYVETGRATPNASPNWSERTSAAAVEISA